MAHGLRAVSVPGVVIRAEGHPGASDGETGGSFLPCSPDTGGALPDRYLPRRGGALLGGRLRGKEGFRLGRPGTEHWRAASSFTDQDNLDWVSRAAQFIRNPPKFGFRTSFAPHFNEIRRIPP